MRCVLCDDHPIVLLAQSMALETRGHEVVATAAVPGELLELVDRHDPDVCLTDLFFGEHDQGEETLEVIRTVSRRTDVIVVTGSATIEQQTLATDAGAVAVVSKGASNEVVMALVEGRSGHHVAEGPAGPPSGSKEKDRYFLTARELEVLQCLADGLSTERIATSLQMRHATARSHVQSVLLKLGVHTRTAAVAKGIRSSLIVADVRAPAYQAMARRLTHPSAHRIIEHDRRAGELDEGAVR